MNESKPEPASPTTLDERPPEDEACEGCGAFLGRGGNYLGMCLKCRKIERLNGKAWQGKARKEIKSGKQKPEL